MAGAAGEKGQALIAVLVVMAIVFGLAGGLATLTASLLDRQQAQGVPLDEAPAVHNAVTAALAQVAWDSAGTSCRPGHHGDAPPSLEPVDLPAGPPSDGFTSQAVCVQVSGHLDLGSGSPTFAPAILRSPCTTFSSRPDGHFVAWFVLRGDAGSLRADLGTACDPDQGAGHDCALVYPSESVSVVVVDSSRCHGEASGSALNVTWHGAPTAVTVRFAPVADSPSESAGPLYSLVVPWAASAYEQVDLFVGGGSKGPAAPVVRFEAPL